MANACGKECSKLPSGGGAACAHAALARRDKPMLALTEVSRIDAPRPLKSRTSRDACPPSLRPSWNTSFIRYAIAPAVLRAPNEYVNIVIHTILVQIWVASNELQESVRRERSRNVFRRFRVPVLGARIDDRRPQICGRRRKERNVDSSLAAGHIRASQTVVRIAICRRNSLHDLAPIGETRDGDFQCLTLFKHSTQLDRLRRTPRRKRMAADIEETFGGWYHGFDREQPRQELHANVVNPHGRSADVHRLHAEAPVSCVCRTGIKRHRARMKRKRSVRGVE